jgi:predicted CXXCH cytochrome family protein
MTSMSKLISFSLIFAALLLFSGSSQALMAKHQCGFCHSLHGSATGLVPRSDQINMEVLCMGCHLTANGGTAAVQPHRNDGGYPEFHVTCTDCHEVHDNMPNWRLNDPLHAVQDDVAGRDGTEVRPGGWPAGYNTKMIGREDPDGETPYAIIITKEADYDKDGTPDRNTAVTQTCTDTVANDCYVTRKRHVIFENRDASDSAVSIHGWADHDEDTMSPPDASSWGETVTDWGDTAGAGHDAICHMCHTFTAKNACGYDGSANCTVHNQARACTDCHTHDGCFDKGSGCTPWTLPNRDVRMDTVSATPTSVNVGQTVTITADFTNLGDATEIVRVKFYSDIEKLLGIIEVIDVAPGGGTGQAQLNWPPTIDGSHSISAEAQPVLAEINVVNNAATFGSPVTVASIDTHDIAVTSVSAPNPIQQGDTVTVTVNITNQGTFTEGPFDVILSSGLDGAIGTLNVTTLAASASTGVDFSWNTTGATLGEHVLTGTAVVTDDVPGNDSATTNATVAVHDVAVTSVTAPASVDQDTVASVDVNVANNSGTGGFADTVTVNLYNHTSDPGHTTPIDSPKSSINLAAGGTDTLNFSWDTTGLSIGTYELRAIANTVAGETITANNTATTTSDVIAPVTHDVGVVQIQTVGNVEQGNTEVVLVDVWNYGGAAETFNVTLSSNQDGSIDSPQLVTNLAASTGTTVSFNWVTGAGTTVGAHTLTATTSLGTDSNASNDNGTTGATILEHDLSVISVTDTPDPVTVGGTVTIDATVSNIGDYAETFNVTLTSDLDGLIHTWTNVNLASAATTPALTFNWDTTGATTGLHTLTATAATVANEFITGNNSAITTTQVDAAGAPDVAIVATDPGSSCKKPCDHTITITVQNIGTISIPASFNVTLYDDTDVATIGVLSTTGALAVSASEDLVFTWATDAGMSNGVHILRAVAETVTGETVTVNNTATFDSARVK